MHGHLPCGWHKNGRDNAIKESGNLTMGNQDNHLKPIANNVGDTRRKKPGSSEGKRERWASTNGGATNPKRLERMPPSKLKRKTMSDFHQGETKTRG